MSKTTDDKKFGKKNKHDRKFSASMSQGSAQEGGFPPQGQEKKAKEGGLPPQLDGKKAQEGGFPLHQRKKNGHQGSVVAGGLSSAWLAGCPSRPRPKL